MFAAPTFRRQIAILLLLVVAVPPAMARTWTDSSGKFSVEAELVKVDATGVQLRKRDGQVVTVPLKMLSAKDKAFLREAQAKGGDQPAAAGLAPAAKTAMAARGRKRQPLPAALARAARIDLPAGPMSDAIAGLSEAFQVTIHLDVRSLEELGVSSRLPVEALAGQIELSKALDEITQTDEITWLVTEDVIVITTEEAAENRYLETRVYSLAGNVSPDEIVNQIRAQVTPPQWDTLGGPCSIMSYGPGTVAIMHHWQGFSEIERTFPRQLRRSRGQAAPGANANIDRKLATLVSFNAQDVPLSDVATHLATTSGVNIDIDAEALEEIGLSAEIPISIQLESVRHDTLLQLLLAQIDLCWTHQGDGIVITTEEAENWTAHVYDVTSVVLVEPQTRTPASNLLMDLTITMTAPDGWAALGGLGTIAINPRRNQLLFQIKQSNSGHRLVRQLYADLKQSRR